MGANDAEPKDAARAAERLRLAEAQLARRRQTACGPSESARAAMRFIQEKGDSGSPVTPTDIAQHLGITTPSVTLILNRLRTGGLITFVSNPDDGRSKRVVPLDRGADPDDHDPLTARIRDYADALSASEREVVVAFLHKIADAVDEECR